MEFVSFFTLVIVSLAFLYFGSIYTKEIIEESYYRDFYLVMLAIALLIIGIILGYTAYTLNPFDIVFSIGIK